MNSSPKKKYAEAAKEYSQILDEFGQNSPQDFIKIIFCNRAACYIELGHHTRAISDLNAVLKDKEHTPDSIIPKAYFRLARCHFELVAYDEAKVQFENYERSLDPTTNSVNQLQPAVIGLKKSITDKTDEKKAGSGESTSTKKSQDAGADQSFPFITYDARVLGTGAEPFIKTERAPPSICVPRPPEMPTKAFLAMLVKKYSNEILHSQQWHCWNCNRLAEGLVHTPSSYLHQEPPSVVDFIQPVCVNGGECERKAKVQINEELRAAARVAGMR